MITEIPTASEFQAAGINQLYLAWQIAMQAVHDYEEIAGLILDDEAEEDAASAEFWTKSQPALANAFGLIQQAMEMALKGRIASISPFLLISRDPKDWPKGADTVAVPFSEFRTLDAADLVKVHNTFSSISFDENFRAFWDNVRRDRNKIMHSFSPRSFDPQTLVRTILTAAEALFSDMRWPQRLLIMEAEGKYAAYGLNEGTQNAVMWQIDVATHCLTPAENKRFFGYDSDRRSYLCPNCYLQADRDYQESWPKLAQFPSRSPGQRALHCVVCDETIEIERVKCTDPDCQGDVIYDGKCLTCERSQDDPSGFRSGLADADLPLEFDYDLLYVRDSTRFYDTLRFPNDAAAKEHARLAMQAPHLTQWSAVTLYHGVPGDLNGRRLLGNWSRLRGELAWNPGTEVDVDDLDSELA